MHRAFTACRWFHFSLRTMFVFVTLFAVWLGWELKYIRDRKACLRRLAEDPENLVILTTRYEERGLDYVALLALSEPVTVPVWRRWLGDEALVCVCLAVGSDFDVHQIHRLFPEADEISRDVQLGFDDADPFHERAKKDRISKRKR